MYSCNAIIISVSSDIGLALAEHWLDAGISVFGTFRSASPALKKLEEKGGLFVHCDLTDENSSTEACSKLTKLCSSWDILVLCAGTTEPIGPFIKTPFLDWRESVGINFTEQLGIIHSLLPNRNLKGDRKPLVLTFAGGGTNNANLNYSAYTVSKIALIKMMELLDAEITDTRFTIAGPGWVKTKIHNETLNAGNKAGANLHITESRLKNNDFTDMREILRFCDWALTAHRKVISGRNFSVVNDKWGEPELEKILSKDMDIYKLRRSGNAILKRDEHQ